MKVLAVETDVGGRGYPSRSVASVLEVIVRRAQEILDAGKENEGGGAQ